MPLFATKCECGSQEGFDRLKDRETQGGKVHCLGCDALVPTRIVPAALHNLTWPGGKYFSQVGRTFFSRSEMEKWASKEGLRPVEPSSREWKGLKSDSRDEADKEAKSEGWRNACDRNKSLRDNHRDHVAASQEAQIAKYHDEHGTDNKQSIEEAYGPLPEEGARVTVSVP